MDRSDSPSTNTPPRKKQRILAADVQWCVDNRTTLTLKSFAERFSLLDKQYAVSRYTSIIHTCHLKADQERLQSELNLWKESADYKLYWIERTRKKTHLDTSAGCTDYVHEGVKEATQALFVSSSTSTDTTAAQKLTSSHDSISTVFEETEESLDLVDSEQPIISELEEPVSFLTDTTDESFNPTNAPSNYGELLKQRQYILTLDELNGTSLADQKPIYYMDNDLSLDERLLLSSICYIEHCPLNLLPQPCIFSDQTYIEIRKWRRTRMLKTDYFPTQTVPNDPPTEDDIFQRNLCMFLLNLTETLDRVPLYEQSEIDFTVQNVSILLRFVFNAKSNLSIAWERSSETNETKDERHTRLDFLIHHDKQELGCGEIKVGHSNKKLLDEDRARLGERMKKQLHYRIKKAKSTYEFFTFGLFIFGDTIELYRSTFSIKTGYKFVLVCNIVLPTLTKTYTSIEESLEILFSFKDSIVETLPKASACEEPYIYPSYASHLKPTISFV